MQFFLSHHKPTSPITPILLNHTNMPHQPSQNPTEPPLIQCYYSPIHPNRPPSPPHYPLFLAQPSSRMQSIIPHSIPTVSHLPYLSPSPEYHQPVPQSAPVIPQTIHHLLICLNHLQSIQLSPILPKPFPPPNHHSVHLNHYINHPNHSPSESTPNNLKFNSNLLHNPTQPLHQKNKKMSKSKRTVINLITVCIIIDLW